ncbi:MAG TPA: hypothetical protein VJM50_17050 [Pyrinomonadaceae bacterium]|nr:hypothetical protein [Pyrinomonadaceae bacterium]
MNQVGQAVVFETDFLIGLGRRAAAAAAAGAETFALPEFEAVAAAIASDRRVEQTSDFARRWLTDGASYHDLIRLCANYVMELEAIVPACEPVYVPKARDELEPLLALWPHVLALPAIDDLCPRDLIRLRAFPVHPLGVTGRTVWADGRQCSPAEFFFHDVDHARFKVREDLLAMGLALSDPYQDGTFDPVTQRHRAILPEAFGKVGFSLWSLAASRCSFVESTFNRMEALPDRSLADAAEWLLFQILHEKSFPLDVSTLRHELTTSRHVELLRTKVDNGFYDNNAPSSEIMAQLSTAREWLLEVL